MKLNSYFAVCPFGLEESLKGEIESFGGQKIFVAKGGVAFAGTDETAMLALLHSRFATRVLLEVLHSKYWDSRDLYELARKTPWEKWFGPDDTFRIATTANQCPLESINFATLRIKDGICDHFIDAAGRRPDVDRHHADVTISVYIEFETVTYYLDLAGESLFKRGWRLTHGETPLKENLACGLLALSGWDSSKTLMDPFCGSGTIAIEAARQAVGMAPGLNRRFAMENLATFDKDLFEELREDAKSRVNIHAPVKIYASDISSLVVEKAKENARRAGLGPLLDDGRLVFETADARIAVPPEGMEPGILIANPPYGEQSNPKSASIQSMMKVVADNLKVNFSGWTAWLLSSDRGLPRQMRLKESRKIPLFNGPLECRFFKFDMVAGSNRRRKEEE